jgi:LPS-assembly lipoprotein
VLLLASSVSACGFRLRGGVELPPELKETRIVGIAEFSPLAIDFKRVLSRAGSVVRGSTDATSSAIVINGGNFTRRVLSVDASGRVAEYEIKYTYTFKILGTDNEELIPLQKIELTRDYRFDPGNVLAKDTEEAQLRSEMVRFSVSQAMRRINAMLQNKPQS